MAPVTEHRARQLHPPARRRRLRPLGTYAVVLIVAGVLLVLLSGWFVVRLAGKAGAHMPKDPMQTDVMAIQGWMTIGYVARAYRVPEPELMKVLGPSAPQLRNLSLMQAAQQTGQDPERLLESVRGAVRAFQQAHPPPP
jgi:hypothetical protein